MNVKVNTFCLGEFLVVFQRIHSLISTKQVAFFLSILSFRFIFIVYLQHVSFSFILQVFLKNMFSLLLSVSYTDVMNRDWVESPAKETTLDEMQTLQSAQLLQVIVFHQP